MNPLQLLNRSRLHIRVIPPAVLPVRKRTRVHSDYHALGLRARRAMVGVGDGERGAGHAVGPALTSLAVLTDHAQRPIPTAETGSIHVATVPSCIHR